MKSPKFNLGDRVRITRPILGTAGSYLGETGVIIAVSSIPDGIPYRVRLDKHPLYSYWVEIGGCNRLVKKARK